MPNVKAVPQEGKTQQEAEREAVESLVNATVLKFADAIKAAASIRMRLELELTAVISQDGRSDVKVKIAYPRKEPA